MIKKIKSLIVSSALVLVSAVAPAALATATVGAQDIQEGLNKGTCLNTTATECGDEDPDTAINNIIKTVIDIFSLVVGVISVIMIIIGGLKYITSGGEAGNISGAKNTILYAIIGLVVVALAQVITRFVIGRVTE